jgi:uncharacterized protein
MDDQVFTPERRDAYQLTFEANGKVSVRADCNRGQGGWQFEAPSGLQFGPIATTRMACPPDSLDDRVLSNLQHVRSFVMRDGDLYLATMADGAILAFSPAGPGDSAQAAAAGPSFDCGAVADGGIEARVCEVPRLSALDRQLAAVFAAASGKAGPQSLPTLRAEQRGWIKGRDECWQSEDQSACVANEYQHRIAELQASYRVVDHAGPVHYACEGNPANEVVATYFETDPPTLVAERGDQVSVMYREPRGSGARYAGRNETLWEHQGEATIQWGYDAPEMHCVRAP